MPDNTKQGAPPSASNTTSESIDWSYAPAPETFHVDIDDAYGHYIGGEFTSPGGDSNQTFQTLNPATEQPLADITLGSAGDVDAAVNAARAALPHWSSLDPLDRGKYLFRIARRVQERARELAVLESRDGGKPIRESRDFDVPLVAHHFFYNAGWADKLPYAFPGANTIKPVGVCGQIIPWNFPLLMLAWKIAPALACGNTVVLKPAETTPLTALRFAEICHEIGLPPGVVNIVTGDGSTGQRITEHQHVDKLAFTGSTSVGKAIAKTAGERGIPATLELGGKGAHIVFADAALDEAVEGVIRGIYFNQGHVCCAGSRLLVEESARDEFLAKLKRRMNTLRVGDPLDKNTDVGAINSKQQLDTITRYVETGRNETAGYHEAGTWTNGTQPTDGYFHKPCLFEDVHQSHAVARDEVFGPVLAVMTFRTADEAVTLANNTRYGLSAGVWTEKGTKMFAVARALKAGVIWCNTFNAFDPASAFGGFKESGYGREGGTAGLRPYVKIN